MRDYSLTELFHMSRRELFALHAQIVTAISVLAASDVGREVAQGNLRRIRRVLANAKLTL